MNDFLSISEMAAATGLSAHTLRYYERAGLVRSVARAGGGQRQYSAADRAWVEFLKRLRATGMGIGAMKHFADLRYRGDSTAGERRVLLEAQLDSVRAQLRELAECERALVYKIAHYRTLEADMASSSITERTGHERTLRARARKAG